MKQMLIGTLVLLLGCVSGVHAEAVLDHQDGQYYEYDVSCWGDQATIYDFQRDTVIQSSRAGDRTILYDQGTGSFYEIQKTGPRTYVGYDCETGTTQFFRIHSDGSVSVYGTDSAETMRFTGGPR